MKRTILGILVAMMILSCYLGLEVGALTENQTKVQNHVLEQVGDYWEKNKCQAFAAHGYSDAGIGCKFAEGIHCANYAYQRFVVYETTDINETIPIGACVYFKNVDVNCGCGKDAGHVGIYVGDGYFVHARASQEAVCKNRLSESYYKSRYIGWGWYNDFELADDGLTIEGRYYIANDPDGAHNVRASASSSANIVTKIPNGTKVLVTKYSSDNQWGYLTYNGISGWTVLSPYMEFDSVCYEVCEHNYSSTSYESTHPHKEYKKCSLCGDIQYTGNTKLTSGCTSCYPPDGYLYKCLDNDTSNPSYPGKWLRSSDSTSGTIVGSVPYGEYAVVTKYNSDKTWAYVKYKGVEGWTKLYESTFPYQDTYYCPVVTFNANGGSVSTSSKKVYLNNPYGTLPTPTRTGYKFNGWYTSSSGGSKITSTTNVNLTANQTLYAQWTANKYTITYNANGGSGAPANQTKIHGTNLTLSSTVPTKSGYTFKGWSTSANGSVAYTAGATYSANSAVTLYAVWERDNIDAESLVLGEHKTVFEVGETDTVSLSVVPSNADWETMYFLYYDSDVVELDWINNENAFKVTAIAPGETEIVIELENTSGSTIATRYQVEVKSPVVSVTGITLNKTSTTLNVGDTEILTATVTPSNATNKTVTWTSSIPSVASVSNGVITAKAAGTATITVNTSDGSKTATCVVTVNEQPIVAADVIYTISSASGKPGDSVEVTLSVASDVVVNGLLLDNLTYDKNVFEFVEFADYSDLITTSALGANGVDSANGVISLGYTEAVKPNGEICVIKLRVKDAAEDGEYTISVDGAASANGQKLPSIVNSGKITISKWVSGDFDSDEKLDMKDVVHFMNWINFSWTGKYPMLYEGDKDFNKDGNVDMKDVVYFMNWVNFSWTGNYDINW